MASTTMKYLENVTIGYCDTFPRPQEGHTIQYFLYMQPNTVHTITLSPNFLCPENVQVPSSQSLFPLQRKTMNRAHHRRTAHIWIEGQRGAEEDIG